MSQAGNGTTGGTGACNSTESGSNSGNKIQESTLLSALKGGATLDENQQFAIGTGADTILESLLNPAEFDSLYSVIATGLSEGVNLPDGWGPSAKERVTRNEKRYPAILDTMNDGDKKTFTTLNANGDFVTSKLKRIKTDDNGSIHATYEEKTSNPNGNKNSSAYFVFDGKDNEQSLVGDYSHSTVTTGDTTIYRYFNFPEHGSVYLSNASVTNHANNSETYIGFNPNGTVSYIQHTEHGKTRSQDEKVSMYKFDNDGMLTQSASKTYSTTQDVYGGGNSTGSVSSSAAEGSNGAEGGTSSPTDNDDGSGNSNGSDCYEGGNANNSNAGNYSSNNTDNNNNTSYDNNNTSN